MNSNGTLKTLSSIHGHHIVMKRGGGWAGRQSRKILKDYNVPLLRTQKQLLKTSSDQLHNMSYAINGYKGIHSRAYAGAVRDRLKNAVAEGGSFDEIRQRIIGELTNMREILEVGGKFW